MPPLYESESWHLNERKSIQSDKVAEALIAFRGIRNPYMRKLFYEIIPWSLILSIAVFIFLSYKTYLLDVSIETYAMYLSMILAVALTFFVFKILMESIPNALGTIWTTKIIAIKVDTSCKDSQNLHENISEIIDANLKEKFLIFLKNFEYSLNNKIGEYTFGIIFALIIFARSIYKFAKWLPGDFPSSIPFQAGGSTALLEGIQLYINVYLTRIPTEQPLKFLTGFIVEPIIGFLLGIIAWKLFATGAGIIRINREFDLVPHLSHPDNCGGLEPLGNLCLHNALIVSVWGLFLGSWILLGPFTGYGEFYTKLFYSLLPIPMIIAIACFILPAWGIHLHMVRNKIKIKEKLNYLLLDINLLENKRLFDPNLTESNISEISKSIEIKQKIYKDSLKYPEWPFNYRILLAFFTSQAVPLMSLTGIGGPLLNVIKSMMDFLNQIGRP